MHGATIKIIIDTIDGLLQSWELTFWIQIFMTGVGDFSS